MSASLALMVVGVPLAAPGHAAATSHPPVLLYSVPLTTPVEFAPLENRPEVDVQIQIDQRGKVSEAEVLKIRPDIDAHEEVVEEIRSQLLQWRYAPKVENGVGVASSLHWTIQYRGSSGSSSTTTAATGSSQELSHSAPGSDAALERRRRILRLSAERRAALLQKTADLARKYLVQDRIRRADSAHFVLLTDLPKEEAPKVLVQNLEATWYALASTLQKDIPEYPEKFKVVAVVFSSTAAYKAFVSDATPFEWSSGVYCAEGLLAFTAEAVRPSDLLAVMLHETTHAFLDRHVVRRGVALPRWLDEGFAQYVGNSRIKKGHLVLGETPHVEFVATPSGIARLRTSQVLQLDEVQKRIRKGAGLTLSQLLDAGRDVFYSEKRDLYYPMSWMLVHYLRHGGDDWASRLFPQLLLYVAEGYPADAAMTFVYRESEQQLNDDFQRYARKL